MEMNQKTRENVNMGIGFKSTEKLFNETIMM